MLRSILLAIQRGLPAEIVKFRSLTGVIKTRVVAVSVNFPSIAAAATGFVDVAVSGVKTTDCVAATYRVALPSGLIPSGVSVLTNGTARFYATNVTGAPIDAAALNAYLKITGE